MANSTHHIIPLSQMAGRTLVYGSVPSRSSQEHKDVLHVQSLLDNKDIKTEVLFLKINKKYIVQYSMRVLLNTVTIIIYLDYKSVTNIPQPCKVVLVPYFVAQTLSSQG